MMVAYTHMLRTQDSWLCFYNGNGFGQSGFGYAVGEDETHDQEGWRIERGHVARAIICATARRPSLEVHVPIAPTPSFLRQLQCLTHSLRRFGGVHSGAR